jgi:8-hydroxy-5-deazaflavin:NADPH oxidoreductase
MEITIIGTGNMARGIATRALAGGQSISLLGTETAKAQALADELSGDVRAGQVGDPLAGSVLVLAVWYAAVDDILGRYSDQLEGKVVVDITNPIDVDAFEPLELKAGSAAQEIAAKAPGARVVKAFNTTFAGTLAEG